MRVLIAYDGSAQADAALEDLRRAGLPYDAEALVVSVADGLVNTHSSSAEAAGTALNSRRVTSAVELARSQAEQLVEEARGFVARACGRLLLDFPGWDVLTKVLEGTPSCELLQQAERWRPDLIVAGSHGRSALGRFFLGSVSEALATGAGCSVRVGRRNPERMDGGPTRLVVGVDGSPGARRAVRAVATRAWPAWTEVRLVVVDDGEGPTRIADTEPKLADLFNACEEDGPVAARLMAEGARVLLDERGLSASVVLREGDPRRVLAEEARAWAADSLFVGARGLHSPGERAGLGGVSAALVTNAACSVEVAR
jgi:nucleotide-binding universal stress UspA family protein